MVVEWEDVEVNTWLTHWKSSVSGLLSAFLATVGPATSFLAAYDALIQQLPGHSHADFRVAIWGMALTAAAAVAKAWIGLISRDVPPPPPPGQQPVTTDQLKAVGIDIPTAPPPAAA